MKRNQKGFAVWLLILLLLLILALIGYAAWKTYQSKQKKSGSSSSSSQSQPANQEPQYEEYVNTTVDFSLQKPKDWTTSETKEVEPGFTEGTRYNGKVIFTSPTGTKLTLMYNLGGIGGACEPDADNKPFQSGNICPSQVYLKVKKVNIDPNNTGRLVGEAFLTRQHVQLPNGTNEYYICLESNDQEEFKPKENKPYTGFVVACGPLSTTQYAVFAEYKTGAEAGLTSSDAAAIEKILESFKLLPFTE